jgi:hypothetical protein
MTDPDALDIEVEGVAAEDDGEFHRIFEALCRERGGREVLGVVELAVLRRLAGVLVADGPLPEGLLALLPPRRAGKPVDLGRLSDRELGHLEVLVAKAEGEDVRLPRERRKRTPRETEALHLAGMIDRIAAAGRKPSALEADEIRGKLVSLAWPVALVQHLFAKSIEDVEANAAAAAAPKPALPEVLPPNVVVLEQPVEPYW